MKKFTRTVFPDNPADDFIRGEDLFDDMTLIPWVKLKTEALERIGLENNKKHLKELNSPKSKPKKKKA
jgi:hypothetical protein